MRALSVCVRVDGVMDMRHSSRIEVDFATQSGKIIDVHDGEFDEDFDETDRFDDIVFSFSDVVSVGWIGYSEHRMKMVIQQNGSNKTLVISTEERDSDGDSGSEMDDDDYDRYDRYGRYGRHGRHHYDDDPMEEAVDKELQVAYAILSTLNQKPVTVVEKASFSTHIKSVMNVGKVNDDPVNSCELKLPSHALAVWQQFGELKNQGVLCDVELVCSVNGEEAERLPAHRLILAANSPIFKTMFSGGMAETKQYEVHVELRGDVARAVLEFCYTGRVTVDEDLGTDLLLAADMYGMEQLADVVCGWLESAVRAWNVLHVWLAAASTRRPHLVNKCADATYYMLTFGGDAAAPLNDQLAQCTAKQLTDILTAGLGQKLSKAKLSAVVDAWATAADGRESDKTEMVSLLGPCVVAPSRDVEGVERVLRDSPDVPRMRQCCEDLLRLMDQKDKIDVITIGDDTEEEEEAAADPCGGPSARGAVTPASLCARGIHHKLIAMLSVKDASLQTWAVRVLAQIAREYRVTVDPCLVRCIEALLLSPQPELTHATATLLHALFYVADGAAKRVSFKTRSALSGECASRLLALISTADAGDKARIDLLVQVTDCALEKLPAGSMEALLSVFSHEQESVRRMCCRALAIPSLTALMVDEQQRARAVAAASQCLGQPQLARVAVDALAHLTQTWPCRVFVGAADGGIFPQLASLMQSLLASPQPSLDDKWTLVGCCRAVCPFLLPQSGSLLPRDQLETIFIEHGLIGSIIQVLHKCLLFDRRPPPRFADSASWTAYQALRNPPPPPVVWEWQVVDAMLRLDERSKSTDGVRGVVWTPLLLHADVITPLVAFLHRQHVVEDRMTPTGHTLVGCLRTMASMCVGSPSEGAAMREKLVSTSALPLLQSIAARNLNTGRRLGYDVLLREQCHRVLDMFGMSRKAGAAVKRRRLGQ